MDTSLDHLPEAKRHELAEIVSLIRGLIRGLIRDKCPADELEMIILFGSYARGDYKEERDLPPRDERKSGHASDYDILVVTASHRAANDTALWNEVNEQARKTPSLSTHARVIAYDIDGLNHRLRDGRYFYVDIVKEGRLLYDSGRATLDAPKEQTAEDRLRIAKEYYEHWWPRAKVFFDDHEHNMQKTPQTQVFLNQAAFNLHQATEAAYKMVLLVLTAYSPDEHYLELLGDMAADEAPSLKGVFPKKTEEQQDRFRLLEYAYIGARYDKDYRIGADDLAYLAERVRDLLDRASMVCTAVLSGG